MAKILIQMTYLNNIGGIETALETLVRTFKDEDITILINARADGAQEQIKRFERYAKVIFDNDYQTVYEADVALLFTPIMQSVPLDNIKAKKIYQFVHSDIKGLMRYPQWQSFTWKPDPRISKVVAVSETAQKGLKEALGVDSVIVPNIFASRELPTTFLFISRATMEKGLDKALELASRFDAAGKDYVLLIASLVDPYGSYWPPINNNPRIIYLGASIHNPIFYRCSDYVIQMSTSESYCYTIREAMAHGCAVIGSKIPEIQKVVKDGVNGYLLDDDLSNLDIDKIFNEVPKPNGYKEKLSPEWEKVFGGLL